MVRLVASRAALHLPGDLCQTHRRWRVTVSITLTSDLFKLSAKVALLNEQQIRKTTAIALSKTVTAARDHLRSELAKTSGGPIEDGATAWTIRGAVASRYVNAARLTAEVGFASNSPRAAGRYLRPLLRGTRPVTKAIDIRLAGGRRGLTFTPSPGLRRTPQGNLSRSTIGAQLLKPSNVFTRPLKGSTALGLFSRSESRIARTDTYEDSIKFLGVLEPGKQRRRTLDLPAMLMPTIQQEFDRQIRLQLQETLRRATMG